jgi:hypothetical protein
MNQKKCPTGIFDMDGKEILQGDTVHLSCNCCFYKIDWNNEKECWWPYDDGDSQIHEVDIDVFDCALWITHDRKKIT